ncbi:MAG TPA: response regulator transcription factor, partial [Herpetosiphonaceae bacterium]|nr:response regulator transcription factor [Herpetosiphonaceae bacterium]
MEPLRVLVADDHPMFRHGMVALLEAAPEFTVVGEAATGDEAIILAAELQPDVILMDIRMPGVNGIEATRRIVYTSPHIRILIVTMSDDDTSIFTAM